MERNKINLSPSQMLVIIFIGAILIGTFLLKLPFASTRTISIIDALFTATSAMTVTGLVVIDTGTTFTIFGQLVILTLIQLGGLGIMTFAVLIFRLLGKKLSIKERITVQQSLNQPSMGNILSLVRNILVFSMIIEAIAALLLTIKWTPELGMGQALYQSIFHSVSAFNNAGFSLWSTSLIEYVGDPVINIIIPCLIILGGIGFSVLLDIWEKKKFRKLSLHSKLMILGTILINLAAMLIILLLEYNNPNTLGALQNLVDKLQAANFQAITTRTAGFNTLDIASLNDSTVFLMLLLMFIGAGSGSTGGGIKLTTIIIIILAVGAFLKGKKDVEIRERSIGFEIIARSGVIAIISLIFILLSIFLLSVTEQGSILAIMFEVFSAFGTVGLSMGLTTTLTTFGKFMIILLMFLGKIGPLTLAYSISKQEKSKIRYPSENIYTG